MEHLNQPLDQIDPKIAALVEQETERQRQTLTMIASENYAPQAVLECQGSALTNKYAEGYPGRRYYGGCAIVDEIEELAIARAKSLFGADHANVQPHSGASANVAAFSALINPGEMILGLDLAHGGHLTHGAKFNFSGKIYNSLTYEVEPDSYLIDMDKVEQIAVDNHPQLIIAGWSSYPRILDFARFRTIANKVGAHLLVDMAHFSGLVAAGLYPNPVPYADVVTSTVHKTLDGPRAGLILSKAEFKEAIDKAVFPGQQGGPLMHVIAAKAVAFHLARSASFKEQNQRAIEGARILSKILPRYDYLTILTGSSDVHFTLLDLRNHHLTGRDAEERLEGIGIVTNRNGVPFDPRPASVASGLRLGTSALACRGFQGDDFHHLGNIIGRALSGHDLGPLQGEVAELAARYPLYPQ